MINSVIIIVVNGFRYSALHNVQAQMCRDSRERTKERSSGYYRHTSSSLERCDECVQVRTIRGTKGRMNGPFPFDRNFDFYLRVS